MLKNIQALFKQSFVYGLGTISERLLAFLMLPIFTNILTREELGIYSLWFSIIFLTSSLYLLGLNNSLIRFYSSTSATEKQQQIFSTCFWTVIVLSSVISGIGIIFAGPLTKMIFDETISPSIIIYLFCTLWLDALNLLTLNVLKAEQRVFRFALISIISGLAIPVITIYLVVYARLGAPGAILTMVLVAALKFLVLLLMVIRKRLKWYFSIPLFKQLLKFGLPFVPTIIAASFMISVDKILIKKFSGFEELGIYGAGYRLGMIIGLFTKAFQYAWEPFIATTSEQEEAPRLYSKIFTWFVLVLGLVFLVFGLFIDEIVHLKVGKYTFFGSDYFECTSIVPIIMLGSVFYGLYLHFIIGAYVQKKSLWFTIVTLAASGANLLLNVILIPQFGMVGAAWASVFSNLIMMLWMYRLNQKFFPIPYEFGRIGQLGILYALVWFLPFFIKPLAAPLLKILLLILIVPVLFFFKFFEKNEINQLKKLFRFPA